MLFSTSIVSAFRSAAPACRACGQRSVRTYASATAESSKSAESKKPKRAASSMPAGTVMKDLSILKDKPDPIALPDEEYPAWLWTLLDEPVGAGTVQAEQKGFKGYEHLEGKGQKGFDFKGERRKLRASNKEDIKARNFLKST